MNPIRENLKIFKKPFKMLLFSNEMKGFTPLKKTQYKSNKKVLISLTGFTLIEVLIGTALLALLTTTLILSFHSFERELELNTTVREIITTLHAARDKTIQGQGALNYGVHFESGKYVLFSGATYNAGASFNQVYTLNSSIEIYSISLAGGSDVVFNRLIGDTSNTGTIAVRIKNNPTKYTVITIQQSGDSGLQATITPTNSRITDSRHLHFNLTWSIQGASTLTFVFNNFPNPDVKFDIPMSGYFNVGQTVFDYQGIFSVDDETQYLRVHTHALDGLSTTISIHRDRRYNTKGVTIYIDPKDIVSYTDPGIATKGTFAQTMTEQ